MIKEYLFQLKIRGISVPNKNSLSQILFLTRFLFYFNFVQYVGVDPLQAGNVVQLVLVLGLTVGWISTYIFRVSNKEMTYAQQLRDYEDKVMEVKFFRIQLTKFNLCF